MRISDGKLSEIISYYTDHAPLSMAMSIALDLRDARRELAEANAELDRFRCGDQNATAAVDAAWPEETK